MYQRNNARERLGKNRQRAGRVGHLDRWEVVEPWRISSPISNPGSLVFFHICSSKYVNFTRVL